MGTLSLSLKSGSLPIGLRFFAFGLLLCLSSWAKDYEVSIDFCPQEQSKWCWAACTQAVTASFDKKFAQGEIVQLTYPKAHCKNLSGEMKGSLAACHFDCKSSPITLSKDEIESELAADRPVVIRVEKVKSRDSDTDQTVKPGVTGHFVVIYGQKEDQYMIWDPAGGGKKLLLTRYQIKSRWGKWTHTISGIHPEARYQAASDKQATPTSREATHR